MGNATIRQGGPPGRPDRHFLIGFCRDHEDVQLVEDPDAVEYVGWKCDHSFSCKCPRSIHTYRCPVPGCPSTWRETMR